MTVAQAFQDAILDVQEKVCAAYESSESLKIVGGGTREHIGRTIDSPALDCSALNGVLDYQPSELVIRVAAGTLLREVNQCLKEQGQMLAFEPHDFGGGSTVGGVLASGLSGSARPWRGAIKDYVLGIGLINGQGQHLHFGGQVMKNVAGYDISRMMVGSLGCFGVITDVSLKVLPLSRSVRYVCLERPLDQVLGLLKLMGASMSPLTGAAYEQGMARFRLESESSWLEQFQHQYGLTEDDSGPQFWSSMNAHTHAFFNGSSEKLWRVSAPKYTSLDDLFLPEQYLMDWAGAQYWVRCSPNQMEQSIEALKSRSAVVYSFAEDDIYCLPTMSPYLSKLHKNLKLAYDPKGVFNVGRMSDEF